MKLFLSVFVSLFAFTATADTHSDDELAVLESLNAYYDARRNDCLLYTSDAADE